MMSMAFILALFSVGIEMYLVVQYEWARIFLIKHEKFGLFFSFALSWGMGEAFGAHGVIALFAGVVSTGITIVIYKSHALHLVDTYRQHSEEMKMKVRNTVEVTIKAIKFWWKLFTAPIRFILWVKREFWRAIAWFKSVVARIPHRKSVVV